MRLPRAIAVAVVVACQVGAATGAESGAARLQPASTAEVSVPAPAVGLEAIPDRIEALEASLGRHQASATEDAKSAAAAIAALGKEIVALREQVTAARPASGPDTHTAKALEQIQTRLGGLERLLVPGGNPAETAFPYPRLAAILAALAALLALIAIVAIFWARPGSRGGGGAVAAVPASVVKHLAEIQKTLEGLTPAPAAAGEASGGGAKIAADAASTLVQTTNALRTTVEKVARDNKALSELVGQFQAIGAGIQPAIDSLGARVAEIEQSRASLASEQQELERRRADAAARLEAEVAAKARAEQLVFEMTEKLRTAEAGLGRYEVVWPEAFHGNGPLEFSRERVLAAFGAGSIEAGALMTALIRWHIVRATGDKEREHWIEAADAVGRACQAFLAKDPAPGGESESLERAQLWTRAIKSPFEQAFPELKLNAVYPGDRFDTDRMEAVGSSTGGRQTVQRALSWSILEKTADSTRIVRRAQVITA